MTGHSARARKSFRRTVLERFLVAFVFGNLIAWGVTLPLVARLPLVAQIQQVGASAAMSLASRWNDFATPKGVALPPGATHITLVNIDESACQAIAGFLPCRFDRIGHAELLDAALAAADRSGAPVIVFDIPFPSNAEAQRTPAGRRLLARIMAGGRPIVAPIDYGDNPERDIGINWANSICGHSRCGRLRLAPAFAFPRFDTMRSYPGMVSANAVESLSGDLGDVHAARLPSLALAAADALGPVAQRPDAIPLLFTIPSFAIHDRPGNAALLKKLHGSYFASVDYVTPQPLKGPDGSYSFDFRQRPESILVIGSSAPVMDDWHETPLGTMAGMEVLANAIRTIELRETSSAPPPESLWRWPVAVLSWAALSATVAALVWIERKRRTFQMRRKRAGRAIWIVDRYTGLTLTVLAAAFGVEFVLKLVDVILALAEPGTRNGELDIVFPLLAIFFTTGVELSGRFLAKLEWASGALVDRVRGAVARMASRNPSEPVPTPEADAAPEPGDTATGAPPA